MHFIYHIKINRSDFKNNIAILLITVWQFQDFSVIQIFREINFGESINPKNAVFAILGALYFDNLVNFSLQKVLKFMKITARQFIEDDRF